MERKTRSVSSERRPTYRTRDVHQVCQLQVVNGEGIPETMPADGTLSSAW